MSISNKDQSAFLYDLGRLFLWCEGEGHIITGGDLYRDERAHAKYGEGSGCAGYSSSKSEHKHRMACDLWLIQEGSIAGPYGYLPLAKYWESLNPQNRSGGRYDDWGHFERIKGYDNRDQKPLEDFL